MPACKISHTVFKEALNKFVKLHPQLLPTGPTLEITETLIDSISYSFRILLHHFRTCKKKPSAWSTVSRAFKDRESDQVAAARVLSKIRFPKKKQEDDTEAPEPPPAPQALDVAPVPAVAAVDLDAAPAAAAAAAQDAEPEVNWDELAAKAPKPEIFEVIALNY